MMIMEIFVIRRDGLLYMWIKLLIAALIAYIVGILFLVISCGDFLMVVGLIMLCVSINLCLFGIVSLKDEMERSK